MYMYTKHPNKSPYKFLCLLQNLCCTLCPHVWINQHQLRIYLLPDWFSTSQTCGEDFILVHPNIQVFERIIKVGRDCWAHTQPSFSVYASTTWRSTCRDLLETSNPSQCTFSCLHFVLVTLSKHRCNKRQFSFAIKKLPLKLWIALKYHVHFDMDFNAPTKTTK